MDQDSLTPGVSIEDDDENKRSGLEEIERYYSKSRKLGEGSPLGRSVAFSDLGEELSYSSGFSDTDDDNEPLAPLNADQLGPIPSLDHIRSNRSPWYRLFLYLTGMPPREVREKYMITDSLSGPDIENKFASLSLAFKTDKLTLNNRLDLQKRQRDVAERNIEEEILELKSAIGGLNKVCSDAETRDMLQRLQQQVDVLRHSSERVSSSAEVYGAVQQEARISRAIEIMLSLVDKLKRIYEREHTELVDAKKVLAEHNLSVGDHGLGGQSGDSGHNNSTLRPHSQRGRSISVINPSGTVTFEPGTHHGGHTDSPKLRRASVGVSPSAPKSPHRLNVVESGHFFPPSPKGSRKQGVYGGNVRKISTGGVFVSEGRESVFSTIEEHSEPSSAKGEESAFRPFEYQRPKSSVSGLNAPARSDLRVNEDKNNNSNNVIEGILKKGDELSQSTPDFSTLRNRRSDRVRSTSLIEPVKEEEEDAILEEIDTLALKRDSSPAPPMFQRERELPARDRISYWRLLRGFALQFLEWYQDFTWPWDWEETVWGVRYVITGILLFAAFLSLVFTFFGRGSFDIVE